MTTSSKIYKLLKETSLSHGEIAEIVQRNCDDFGETAPVSSGLVRDKEKDLVERYPWEVEHRRPGSVHRYLEK